MHIQKFQLLITHRLNEGIAKQISSSFGQDDDAVAEEMIVVEVVDM